MRINFQQIPKHSIEGVPYLVLPYELFLKLRKPFILAGRNNQQQYDEKQKELTIAVLNRGCFINNEYKDFDATIDESNPSLKVFLLQTELQYLADNVDDASFKSW